jgi:hypothetical protein
MKILGKPFTAYVKEAKFGIALLFVVSLIRFALKPLWGIPYEQGTLFASVTIVQPILMLIYTMRVIRTAGTYRDLLGFAAVLSLSMLVFIVVGILIDDFGGIDTYYTDPAHGGAFSPWEHMAGHTIAAVVFTIVLWGIGSLIYAIAGGSQKTAGVRS